MKAIVHDTYGPPEVLHLTDIDKPVASADDVLVRVHAAGVDPGVWHFTAGLPYMVRLMGPGFRAPKTHVRGLDFAGRVEAVGAGDAGRARRRGLRHRRPPKDPSPSTRWHPAPLVLKPANLTFEEAAVVPVSASTALVGLRRGQPPGRADRPDHRRRRRCRHVCGAARARDRRRGDRRVQHLQARLGADDRRRHAIDYTRDDFTTGTRRYDLILDTAGSRGAATATCARPAGTLVIVGGEGGNRWTGGFGRQILRAPLRSPVSDSRSDCSTRTS